MPIYDCGDPDCHECQRAFGPDRTKAFELYRRREEYYAELTRQQIAQKAANSAPRLQAAE